ncbi:MAG: hypothetical protein M3299_07245 [Thermoproteota archaeon]|nr:hypothetical protein [Thermoproteota archaeon]
MSEKYDDASSELFEILLKNGLMGPDRFSFESCYIQKVDGDLESQAKRGFIVL